MNKRQFIAPYVMLTLTPGDDGSGSTVIGGGTGQGGLPTDPISYTVWLSSQYAGDTADPFDGTPNEVDYAYWWSDMMELNPEAYSQSAWERLNPNLPWSTYFDWFN